MLKHLSLFVHAMPPQEKLESPVVKVGKKGLTPHSRQICEIKCRIRVFPRERTFLFETAIESSLPEGFELFTALVDVPVWAYKIVKVPIQNPTN